MSALRAMFSLRSTRSGFNRTIDLFGSGFLSTVEPHDVRLPHPDVAHRTLIR